MRPRLVESLVTVRFYVNGLEAFLFWCGMNVRHPMGVLHSFSIKNIFYDTMDLGLFYFDVEALWFLEKVWVMSGDFRFSVNK